MLRLRPVLNFASASGGNELGSVMKGRTFGTGNILCRKLPPSNRMPPRPPLVDESEIAESFIHGSGPGGQKINKTASKVQLMHKPTGIVLSVQATRSRAQNRKIAREKLAAKIEELEKGPESRTAIVAAKKAKRKSNATKKTRRKYKALEAEKAGKAAVDVSSTDDSNAPGQDSDEDARR